MGTKSIALGLLTALSVTGIALGQQNSSMSATESTAMIGKESKSTFDQQNKKGAAAVGAVQATSAKLSSTDQDLMMQIAKGGMMQLEVSKAALQKANSPEVRELAQAEVDEQTGLSAKLKEIATAKGVELPAGPDTETQAMIAKMQGMSGMELDRMYVQESGINGHEKLDKVMSTVRSNASDASLKDIAKAALPLIKTHLKVSKQIISKVSSSSMVTK